MNVDSYILRIFFASFFKSRIKSIIRPQFCNYINWMFSFVFYSRIYKQLRIHISIIYFSLVSWLVVPFCNSAFRFSSEQQLVLRKFYNDSFTAEISQAPITQQVFRLSAKYLLWLCCSLYCSFSTEEKMHNRRKKSRFQRYTLVLLLALIIWIQPNLN